MANYGIIVKAYPTNKQKEAINRTIGCSRVTYNSLVYYSNKAYQMNQVNELNTHTKLKKLNRLAYLNNIDDHALAGAYMDYKASWNNYMKNSSHFNTPKPKTKKHTNQAYKTQNVKNSRGLVGNSIKLGKYIGNVRLEQKGLERLQKHLKQGKTYKTVTVKLKPTGEYYISFQMTGFNHKEIKPKTGAKIGIDVGQKDYMIYSNGEKYNPDYIKKSIKYENRATFYQQKMSHILNISKQVWKKDKYGRPIESKRYKEIKKKKARNSKKIVDMRNDHNFRHAQYLVDTYDTIILESLDIKYMTQELQSWIAKAVCESAFTDIKTKIIQYAETQGKTVILADKMFPSSQICSSCGYKHTSVSKDNMREWICPRCKKEHDRDVNAAQNLYCYNDKEFKKIQSKFKRTKLSKEYLSICQKLNSCSNKEDKLELKKEKITIKKAYDIKYQDFLDEYHQKLCI